MPITRRTVLRNLGTLTAASALPIIGCKSTAPVGPPPPPGSLRVIFAGPWIVTGDKEGNIIATTDIAKPHSCICEKWVNGTLVGTFNPPPITQADRWRGTFNPPQTSAGFDPVRKAFVENNAPFVKNAIVIPDPRDLHFTLPGPDTAYLGGRLMDGYISDEAGKLLPGIMPYVATILHYHQNAGQQLFSLTLADKINHGDGNQPLTVNSGEDLVFHIVHDGGLDPTPEATHVPRMFSHILTRFSTAPKWKLNLADAAYVANQNPDGVTDNELDLTEPTGMHLTTVSAEMDFRGIFRPIVATYANCSGGGAGGDCCN